MPYESAAALRQALEARLQQSARADGVDLERLRRRVAYTRLLVRLATTDASRWILKGGMALEVRLGDRARMTRDLDLAVGGLDGGAVEMAELLQYTIDVDASDGFRFAVSEPRQLAPDALGGGGWRFHIDARLAGRTFAAVRVDVVDRTDEVVSTDLLRLPDVLGFAGISTATMETVAPAQHFAEKLHALTRDYGRPNTRVRDLVDLVLLIETGLVKGPGLSAVVERVFAARGSQPLPAELSDPPAFWAEGYRASASELSLRAGTLGEATATLRAFWIEASDA